MHVTDLSVTPADLAVEAEARGFESVFLTEHTHIPVRDRIGWRGGEPMPEIYKRLHDPIVGLATAAAVTRTIRLGTGVIVIGQREPLATAKQLASLDRLSGGRLLLGVGYGWLRDELADHGIAWNERRDVWRDHLEAMRRLWTDDEAAYGGYRTRFGPAWSYPKPSQVGGPPVLLGAAGTESSFDDVVKHADGWMPIEGTEPIAARWVQLQQACVDAGRDPSTVELDIYASGGCPGDLDAHRSLGAHRVVIGLEHSDRDTCRRQLDLHQPLIDRYRSQP